MKLGWFFGIMLLSAALLPAQTLPEIAGKLIDSYTLRYIDARVGEGAAALPGQEYTVHYTGWFRDGTKFDSSVDRGTPLNFVQGRRQVIAGWDSGFEGMKVGGKRRLFIPYQLAYGELGRPPQIPAKAELIFDVELLGAKEAAPQPAAGADLSLPLHDIEEHVMALAKAVPEAKYSWRPSPGVRSFQAVFLHLAYGNQLLLNIATNSPTGEALKKQVEENARNEDIAITKDRVLEILANSFAEIHRALDGARASTLTHGVDFFGTQATTNGVLINLETHAAEHLGQAIAYARMNGIVPPWSQ